MNILNASQTQTAIKDNLVHDTDWIIVCVDGKDYAISNVTSSSDGVVGDYVILNAVPISTVV